MKIITLNAWGGIQGQVLFDWILAQKITTDIFCFQEIYDSTDLINKKGKFGENHHLKNELKNLLSEFQCFFRETIYNSNLSGKTDFDLKYGLYIFVRKNLAEFIIDEGDILVHGAKTVGSENYDFSPARNLQYLKLKINGNILNILNFHGIWIKGYGKSDHEIRTLQSQNIIKSGQTLEGEIILTGDFNLGIETKALKILEKELNLRNLIKENNIISTRSKLYQKDDKFADYALVSYNLKVQNFQVPEVEISDHLPIITEIDF